MNRLIIVGLCLLLAACGEGGLDQLKTGEKGRVAQVRSGNTVVLEDGLVVRLTGVDAPNSDQPYAGTARETLQALVLGQEVQLLYGGARRDAYGRALAHVRLVKGRVWVQQRLLHDGAVRVRTYPDNHVLAAPMLNEEARARSKSLGLWALPQYRVLLPVEALDARGLTVVEGRVTDVSTNALGQVVILDGVMPFDVRGDYARLMALSGMEATSLKGKLVRIRGGMRQGGRMDLTHREQVEILRDKS